MPILLKVRDIGASKYKLRKFALMILYISGFSWNGTNVYIYIKYELHLVESLKTNMLISNDIFYIGSFSINFSSISTHIQSCSVDIAINVKHHVQYLKCKVLANVITFISLKSEALVLFKRIFLIPIKFYSTLFLSHTLSYTLILSTIPYLGSL